MIQTERPRLARLTGRLTSVRLPSVRRAALWAAQAACLTAASGAAMLGGLSPFSAALCAAGLARGWSVWAMAAGCALYGALAGWPTQAWAALTGCALIYPLNRLARKCLPRRPGVRDAAAGLEAFAAVLLPGLILSGGLPYNLLTAALSACLAALLAPSLTGALSLSLRRRALLPDEQLSCAILAVTLLIGLCGLPGVGPQAAECAAVLLTLLAASRGPGLGAAGGIACGAALALGTGAAPAGTALGLCGLLAGCLRRLPRPAAMLAFALGNALALTSGVGFTLGGVSRPALLAGCALYGLLPAAWLRRAQGLMDAAAPACDPGRLAWRLRRETGARLNRLAAALDAAARGWSGEEAAPDEQALIGQMREALCADCQDYARCWQGNHPEAGRLMCRLLSEALCRGAPPPLAERPPEAVRHCRRAGQMDRRLQPLLTRLAEERRQARAREGVRRLASRQLARAAQSLKQSGRSLCAPPAVNQDMARLAAAALDRAGLPAAQVTACEESGLEICALPARGRWSRREAKRAAQALSEELGLRLCCQPKTGGEVCFRALPAFAARAGVSAAPAEKGEPCGDAVYVGLLPDGRLMALLSDGMGSGPGAAAESRRTVALLRAFLEAGMESGEALDAVNALLQARPGGELFATVDLCVIDLTTGEACLSKLGACSSLLLAGGQASVIAGGQLPIGILESVAPSQQRLTLRPGDTLILHSDGVADDLNEEDAAWLVQAALPLVNEPPEALARALRRQAARRAAHRDDMSVVAIRMAEAGSETARENASASDNRSASAVSSRLQPGAAWHRGSNRSRSAGSMRCQS